MKLEASDMKKIRTGNGEHGKPRRGGLGVVDKQEDTNITLIPRYSKCDP